MSAVVGTLATMIIQVGASIYNQKYNKETTAQIKKKQQESKRRSQDHKFSRDYDKFLRSCAFQTEEEEKSHIDKLDKIEQDFLDTFTKLAHNDALSSHYPLKVSPYIVSKSVMPVCGADICRARKEVFCLLTNSNDKAFNRDVIPVLDTLLCETISTFWNQNSLHTMCYFPGIWDDSSLFCDEDIANLKSLIKTPTLTISPEFEKKGQTYNLTIKLNMWGIGHDISATITDTGISLHALPKDYNGDLVNDIIKKIYPFIFYAIGYNIDAYYWANYYQTPILPQLISSNKFNFEAIGYESYKEVYTNMFESLVLGDTSGFKAIDADEDQLSTHDITSLNNYSFPERSVAFLKELSNSPDIIKGEIHKTLSAIAASRSIEGDKASIENSFDWNDLYLLKELHTIAKNAECMEELSQVETLIYSILNKESEIIKYTVTLNLQDVLKESQILLSCGQDFDDILRIVILDSEKSVRCCFDSSVFEFNGKTHTKCVNFHCERFLVPKEYIETRRLSIKKKHISTIVAKLTFLCNVNVFYTVLSFDDVISKCKSLYPSIIGCDIIRNITSLEHAGLNYTNDELSHIILCKITTSDSLTHELTLFTDKLTPEFEELFDNTNIINVS